MYSPLMLTPSRNTDSPGLTSTGLTNRLPFRQEDEDLSNLLSQAARQEKDGGFGDNPTEVVESVGLASAP